VVEETPGVLSYQIVQTGSATLVIRLTVVAGSERSEVWQRVRSRALDFLRRQRVSATVTIELSAEPPAVNKRSGKLRHVLALPG